jgi:hypothetical protein
MCVVETGQCHIRQSLPKEMATQSWQKIFEKLWRMDRREFLDRSRQELSKRVDAVLARSGFDFAKGEPRSTRPQPGAFFFRSEQVQSLLQSIRQRLPGQAENIVARAERICAHRFDLLGYEDLDYGHSINWHLDLVHGKAAPRKPFHQIRYLDFAEVGDSKVIWELNRHQHLVTLAKAYRLTGDERYGHEIHSQWRHWHSANPYPLGINWASSLEVAFRSLSWMWVYYLLDGTPALGPNFRQEWLRAQALNGRHLDRYLSTYFSPNTHLLGEAVALFFLGTLCGELSGAERWKARGWQSVLEEARRQVNPDGLHFEQSTYYHVYALDFFLHAALLATANGQSLPKELEQILERMVNALFHLSLAGLPAGFGDDDGGRLFDPGRNRAEHLLDPLATGAILFSRGDFKRLAGGLREETIWLLGQKGIEEWDRIEAQPATAPSAAFESAGLYVLAAAGSQLVIDGGPSVPQSYGHGHADALSLCLQSRGRQLLIDSGTCEYVGKGKERDLFRSTAMHNTLRVDGKDQSEPAGPFSWKHHVRARAEQWITGESFDLFVGSHDGYQRLPSPVEHRRWILALRSGIFLVRDLAEGKGEHRLDISWHLAPELHHQQDHLFRIENTAQGLAVLPVQEHGWAEQVHEGPWSPVYGQQRKTMVLNFGAEVSLPAEFVTLLVPMHEAYSAPGKFTSFQLPDTTTFVRSCRYQTDGWDYRFFFGRKGQPWKSGAVASDAECVCLSACAGTAEPDIILCNGSYVEIGGTRILSLKRVVVRCELIHGNARQVFCSDVNALVDPPAESISSQTSTRKY